jgi:hypothetical protein
MPTINQMRARMTDSHRAGLANIAAFGKANAPGRRDCGATAYDTLLKWGAIQDGKLTEIGKALLSSEATR